MEEQQEEIEEKYKFQSGWDYIIKNHIGIVILVIFVILIAGYLYYDSTLSPEHIPDCYYEDNGCRYDNKWGQ